MLTRHMLLDLDGIEAGEGSDGATHLMMSPLEFIRRQARPGSDGQDWTAKDCFAAINLGKWVPGSGRLPAYTTDR